MASPMMTQYQELKEGNPNALLLFRLGDFYELFYEDAQEGARVLDLVLTRRKNSADGEVPMCGIPYHSAEQYLAKLLAAGYNVAIAEQTEDPSQTKKLVKREIVRVITPGTALFESNLETGAHHAIAAVTPVGKERYALALGDISTGLMRAGVFPLATVREELKKQPVKELVLPERLRDKNLMDTSGLELVVNYESNWYFKPDQAQTELANRLGVASLEGFGFTHDDPALRAAGGLLAYLRYTQQRDLEHMTSVSPYEDKHRMTLDTGTITNLELFSVIRGGQRSRSLWEVINRTQTAMGARLLRDWLLAPLQDVNDIEERLQRVEELVSRPQALANLSTALREVRDIERILARLAADMTTPRDIASLRSSLEQMPVIEELLATDDAEELSRVWETRFSLSDLQRFLYEALAEDPPGLLRNGGVIREGFDAKLDEYRHLQQGGKDWLAKVQEQERAQTGIPSLKVQYNKVFGYYIEVSNTHQDKVPEHYIKRQTLTNAERYITPQLKEFEEKMLSAEEQVSSRERELFGELCRSILDNAAEIQHNAHLIAQIDALHSLSRLALENGYTKPHITEEQTLHVKRGRHPVVEAIDTDQTFIPNDVDLSPEQQLAILTGPNMAGKSTYIRQTALIVLLAHMGSFVPADSATVGVTDHIFTRVGASDNLSEGQSTFMVEMSEAAHILNNATARSLVILDEIGRGTSTYDGMSLASAIAQYIHDTIGARTLFATHYHELTELEERYPGVVNYHVAVEETPEDLVFLRSIEPGGMSESYGITIAEKAGFPKDVLHRARQELAHAERHTEDAPRQPTLFDGHTPTSDSPWKERYEELQTALQEVDVNQLTPLQALQTLADLQHRLEDSNEY